MQLAVQREVILRAHAGSLPGGGKYEQAGQFITLLAGLQGKWENNEIKQNGYLGVIVPKVRVSSHSETVDKVIICKIRATAGGIFPW